MLSDLAFGLAKRGMSVTVISSRLTYGSSSMNAPSFETIQGVTVRRIWTTRFGRSHLTLRSIDYLSFYIAAVLSLLRITGRGDVVIAMTDPPMLSLIATPIAKLRGAFAINWLQDLFPEIAEALDVGGKLSGRLFAMLRKLRNVSLRRANRNVAIGEVMAQRLGQANITNIQVISNWADCDALVPVAHENNHLRSHWNLSERFVIGYSGNLGRAHDVMTLIEAIEALERMSALKVAHRPVHWLFVGGGHALETLKREVDARKMKSVTFRAYQPRELLPENLSAADVHIVSLKPNLEGLIVPSKFYGIAAAGRTVLNIGDRNGEIARLIDRHECGTTIANGDSAALVAAIIAFANDPRRCSEMGQHARTACEAHYSRTAAIDAWSRLLEDVVVGIREQEVSATPTNIHFAPSFDETQSGHSS